MRLHHAMQRHTTGREEMESDQKGAVTLEERHGRDAQQRAIG